MKIANNNLSGVFVQRKVVETVEQPIQYEMPEGLPFYYYFNLQFAMTFIILGIIALIVSFIGSGIFYYFIFFKKKHRCPRCGHTFYYDKKKEPICPKCGIELPLN